MIIAENGTCEMQGYSEELLAEFSAITERMADYFLLAGLPASAVLSKLQNACASGLDAARNRRTEVDATKGFYISTTGATNPAPADPAEPAEPVGRKLNYPENRIGGPIVIVRCDKIRQELCTQGMTQTELAEKAGISATSVGRACYGGRVRYAGACKIAAALGLPVTDIVRKGVTKK